MAWRTIAIVVEAMDSQTLQLKLEVAKNKGDHAKILKRYEQIPTILEKEVYNLLDYILDGIKYHKVVQMLQENVEGIGRLVDRLLEKSTPQDTPFIVALREKLPTQIKEGTMVRSSIPRWGYDIEKMAHIMIRHFKANTLGRN